MCIRDRDIFDLLDYEESRMDMLQMRPIYLLNSKWLKNDDCLKPKMFQRWKNWVRMRKLMKHHINNWEKLRKAQESDKDTIFRAFKIWKNIFGTKENRLITAPYYDLQDRSIIVIDAVKDMKSQISLSNTNISELDAQNKVLVDNTISGQKMALTNICQKYQTVTPKSQNSKLEKNNTLLDAFHKWTWMHKKRKLEEKQGELEENMKLIVNLKLKIKEFDLENQDLILENDQLRRTSMDGIILAQTWKELSEKIKLLWGDLADKQAVVENLVNQNRGLAENIYTGQA